jgi:hypothetical protein
MPIDWKKGSLKVEPKPDENIFCRLGMQELLFFSTQIVTDRGVVLNAKQIEDVAIPGQ